MTFGPLIARAVRSSEEGQRFQAGLAVWGGVGVGAAGCWNVVGAKTVMARARGAQVEIPVERDQGRVSLIGDVGAGVDLCAIKAPD